MAGEIPATFSQRENAMKGHKEETFSNMDLRNLANDAFNALAMWGLSPKDALTVIDHMRKEATAELAAPKSGKTVQ